VDTENYVSASQVAHTASTHPKNIHTPSPVSPSPDSQD
jgi:hypothetical protein